VIREASVAASRAPETDPTGEQVIEYEPEISQEKLRDAIMRVGHDPEAGGVPRLPDLVIVDGGKGQLSSACRELQRLGLYDQPIIGLAKEFEEIYRPGRPLPMLLPEDSGALKLLQRIRDEAHRFANGYHQLLMKRRVAESVLDECPGVSASRRTALLKRFGSVARIRNASVDQIASVPGVGAKLAQTISEFLAQRAP
jgi:excinuclease ABC subunit C